MPERNVLEQVDGVQLGRQLQDARRRAGLTQEQAASAIDAARTTVTAIEKGERRIRAGELIRLAHAYGRQVSDFVRQRPQTQPFAVQFRGPVLAEGQDRTAVAPAINDLEALCRDYLELEEITGSPLLRRYPPEYDTSHAGAEQVGEMVALEERTRLGLGDGPVITLRSVLEQDVGLRIFYIALPAGYSAIYLYNEDLGGCIAVNSLHPGDRQRWSVAHDYGHFLMSRRQARVDSVQQHGRIPEGERLADSFARYFLMPSAGLIRRAGELRRVKGKLTPAEICTLAHFFGVSVEAMTRQLESLRFLPTGTWDALRDRGFKVREAQEALGLTLPARLERKLPARYEFLAFQAFQSEQITEGRLAQFLRMDRLDARRLVQELERHGSDDELFDAYTPERI